MRPFSRLSLAPVLAFGLALVAIVSGEAVERSPISMMSTNHATTPESPLMADPDSTAVANSYGISSDEMSRQLSLQDKLRAIEFSELDEGFVETRSEFGQSYSIEYLTTSTDPADALTVLREQGLADYVSIVQVPRSLEHLEAAMMRVAERRKEVLADLTIDTRSGTVVASVVEVPSAERQREFERNARAPIQWKKVESLAVPFLSGGRSFDVIGCTGGFVIERTTTLARGLSTAAHCVKNGGNFTYQSLGLQLNAFAYGGKNDVAWLTHPLATWEPKVFMGQDGYGVRDVNSKIARGDMLIGDTACKFGKETGYTCGSITDKNVCLSYIPSCASTWLKITKNPNYAVMGKEGDSGGPVMFNNAAMAIVQGGEQGGGSAYIYAMAVSLFDDALGIRVITTQ